MPATVNDLLAAAGLQPGGSVRWGTPLPASRPGIYLVALDASPDTRTATLAEAPISAARVAELLRVRPELRLDRSRPTVGALTERLAGCWLPDETVLYIGLAGTSLERRVSQYYATPLGARRPHAGGWFLKTLSNLDELTVHYAAAVDPAAAERELLKAFIDGVDGASCDGLHGPACPYPFANLIGPTGVRKAHGITGAREPRSSPEPVSRPSGAA
jgi:hypothetical protein